MHLRAKKRWTATVTAVAVAALAGITAFVALPSAAAASGDSAINGFRNVAYFTQWGVYARGYQVKNVDTSGVAAQLTHINYAFANIQYQTHVFRGQQGAGHRATGSDGAGDAWADYGKGYSAAESVSWRRRHAGTSRSPASSTS